MSNSRYNAKPSKNHLLLYFNDLTIAKGEDYKRRKKVLHWFLNSAEHVEATVSGAGGNVYRTHIYLQNQNTEVQKTYCSCPLHEDCKHSAALLLTYMDSLDSVEEENSNNAGLSTMLRLKLEELANVLNKEKPPLAQEQGNFGNANPKVYKPRTALIFILETDNWRTRPSIAMRSMSLLANGQFGIETPFPIERLLESQPPPYATNEDLEIAKLWQTVESHGSNNFYYSKDSRRIDPKLFGVLFERVLNSGRCYLPRRYSQPLKLGPGLNGKLAWRSGVNDTFSLHLEAMSPTESGETKNIPCLRWNVPWYIDQEENICGPVSTNLDVEALDAILLMPPASAKETALMPLALHQLGLAEAIPAPPGATPVEIKLIAPAPILEVENFRALKPLHHGGKVLASPGEKLRVLKFAPEDATPLGPPAAAQINGPIIIEKFDQVAREKLLDALPNLGFMEVNSDCLELASKTNHSQRFYIQTKPHQWLDFSDAEFAHLRALGFQISHATETQIKPTEIDVSELEVEVSNERNWWLSLALNIDINGTRVTLLPILLSAIRGLVSTGGISDSIEQLNYKGRFVVNLPDGGVVALPFDRIRLLLLSLEEIFQGRALKNASDFSVLEISQLTSNNCLAEARWTGANKLLSLVDHLKKLGQVEIVEAPKDFGTTLRHYQIEGLSWLELLAEYKLGGILADDMGLGKTVQLLAHICLQKERKKMSAPFLVVCPTSVLPNWIAECKRFAPHLRILAFHGKLRKSTGDDFKNVDIVVTTYGMMQRDIDIIIDADWHGIALDEAQAIKNYSTKISQTVRGLKARYRFCLTGTPVENHLGELWSQFQFLLPGVLGDRTSFQQTFRNPIEREGSIERKQLLTRRVRPFILRRTKKEVASELPDKIYIEQKIELSGSQRDLYEVVRLATNRQIRKEIAAKGFKHSHIMILDALLKLRQACCHPRLVKLAAAAQVTESEKLNELMEMLEQLREEDRKVLVFSQFTSMLDLIANELNERQFKFVTITGGTRDREKPVKDFQEGDAQVFLISLKAGGTGLNLTAADVVIHYDPWWNPAAEEQATDRAHRIGQTKTVFVYRLIAQGTIEQKMLDLQNRKRQLGASIYDEKESASLSFTESDLDALLAPIEL